ERGGAADEAVEHHPHHQRAEMPARARKPLEHGVLRRLLVEMHRLRIELGRERQDLLAGDVARAEGAESADREIFEVEDHRRGITGRKVRLWPHFAAITTRAPAWLVLLMVRRYRPGPVSSAGFGRNSSLIRRGKEDV